jgi:hypothetical protein
MATVICDEEKILVHQSGAGVSLVRGDAEVFSLSLTPPEIAGGLPG